MSLHIKNNDNFFNIYLVDALGISPGADTGIEGGLYEQVDRLYIGKARSVFDEWKGMLLLPVEGGGDF